MQGTRELRGRPRKYNPEPFVRSDSEIELVDRVMRHAEEHGTGFETAYKKVVFDGQAEVQNRTPRQETLSLGAASRAAGVGKGTMGRWVQSGRIVGIKDRHGVYQIPKDQLAEAERLKHTARQGKRTTAASVSTPAADPSVVELLERLVEAEKARADAAERRYAEIVRILGSYHAAS
jgi:transposase